MSDYEKVLEKAGFVKVRSGRYINTRPESVERVQIHPNSFTFQTNRPLSDLASALNPITPEKVEKAVREVLQTRVMFPPLSDDAWKRLIVNEVLTRLKEEQPEDV